MKSSYLMIATLCFALTGCMKDENIYGCCVGQTVTGNKNFVNVSNVWNGTDALPIAEKHCALHDREAEFISMQGILATFNCVDRIVGNKNYVTIANLGKGKDALWIAEKHCSSYGRSAKFSSVDGIQTIFDCVR